MKLPSLPLIEVVFVSHLALIVTHGAEAELASRGICTATRAEVTFLTAGSACHFGAQFVGLLANPGLRLRGHLCNQICELFRRIHPLHPFHHHHMNLPRTMHAAHEYLLDIGRPAGSRNQDHRARLLGRTRQDAEELV